MTIVGSIVVGTLLCIAGAITSVNAQQNTDEVSDEVIVLGRIGELRREMLEAEEAVYLRFNDINSDDRFDIECRAELYLGSRIPRRQCLSNDWRAQEAAYGQAVARRMRGEAAEVPEQYLAARDQGQREMAREVRRLSVRDEQLALALLRLGEAEQALWSQTGLGAAPTASRQIAVEEYGLPVSVQRVFEVRIGRAPWTHAIEQRSFTITNVQGKIRKIEINCPSGNKVMNYEVGVDWTLPEAWRECSLLVSARKKTTFALVEF